MLRYSFTSGPEKSSPLALMVHGRAGNLSAMSTFKRCIPESWALLSVEAPFKDPIGGFSWWRIGTEDSPDTASDLLLDSLDSIFKIEGISPGKTVAIGFSQGAALLSIIAQKNPERFAAIAFLAGFVIKREVSENGKKPALFFAHGEKDETLAPEKAKAGYEYLSALGYKAEFHADNVGHKVGTAGMKALKKWLSGNLV
jgi:phospholipase/carboxylesterase